MPHPPRITVVTPSFRHAHYLEATLASVLGQNYPDLEYLVIDGGSTDGTVEILRRWEGRLSAWVSEPDGGAQDAIHKGLRRATGDVCAWLNASDTYLPGSLRAVADFFAAHPSVDWICGDVVIVDTAGVTRGLRRILPVHGDLMSEAWTALPQPGIFWRRGLFEAVGGFDPSLRVLFDTDLFIRMARRGRFAHLPRLLARDLLHGDSLRSRHADVTAREWELVRRRHPASRRTAWRVWRRAGAYLAEGRLWEGIRDLSEGIAFDLGGRRRNGWAGMARSVFRAPAMLLWKALRLGRPRGA